jgi:hypothetical protein
VQAIAPFDVTLIGEPEIELVHECGRLQRVTVALAAEVSVGHFAERLVDDVHQPIARFRRAGAPLAQQLGHVGHGGS